MSAGRSGPLTRAELRSQAPAGYRWWRHAALVAAFVLAGIALAVSRLEDVRPWQWLCFVGMLLFANFGEWAVHRTSLHRPRFPYAVYRRHVIEHHAFFTFDDMAVDDLRDVRWVLFPPWALPLMLAAVAPIFLFLRLVLPENCAWLFLLAVVAYYGVYEVFHALAHLPGSHPLAGLGPIRAFTRHHRVHHDPRLMKRWNFNFAVPLFDWLFGTLYAEPGSAGERLRAARRTSG